MIISTYLTYKIILFLKEIKTPRPPPSKASFKKESSIFKKPLSFPGKQTQEWLLMLLLPKEEIPTLRQRPPHLPSTQLPRLLASSTSTTLMLATPPNLSASIVHLNSKIHPPPPPYSRFLHSLLLLCHESDSNTFHLLNPFINDSTRRIPDPPRYYNNHVIPTVVLAMRRRMVLLYLLDTRIENLRQYHWSNYRSLDLDQAGLGLGMSCSQELLRFDNDVPLWIGNQCILWEVTRGDEDDQNARFREFYGWEFAPPQESSTIPYIRSERTLAEFNIKEESDDETGDEEEEDGEK